MFCGGGDILFAEASNISVLYALKKISSKALQPSVRLASESLWCWLHARNPSGNTCPPSMGQELFFGLECQQPRAVF